MAKERVMGSGKRPWETGNDAAYIEPRFIPDTELLPRDDSGGPDFMPHTAAWGDAGYVTGDKAHLSAHGGKKEAAEGDEETREPRSKAALKAMRDAN